MLRQDRGRLKSQLENVDAETKARIWKLLSKSERPKPEEKAKENAKNDPFG